MEIETATVARQYRLMEWADQIRDCQSRPNGMSVDEWCHTHAISKANYYYRLSQVRKACLDQMQKEPVHQSIVPVQMEQLKKETLSSDSSLEMNINGITLRITESTSDELLKKVLRLVADDISRLLS